MFREDCYSRWVVDRTRPLAIPPIKFLLVDEMSHALDVELLVPLSKIVELLLLGRTAHAARLRQGIDASHQESADLTAQDEAFHGLPPLLSSVD